MKLSTFVLTAVSLNTADAFNLRAESEVERYLTLGNETIDTASVGGAQGDLEVYCVKQASIMKTIVDGVTESAISAVMQKASDKLSPFVNDDFCHIMGCTSGRRLQMSGQLIMRIVSIVSQMIVKQINAFSLEKFGIDLDSVVETFTGTSLTDAVSVFSKVPAPDAEMESVTEMYDTGAVEPNEDDNTRKLQVDLALLMRVLQNPTVQNIMQKAFSGLLDTVGSMVSLAKFSVENAPQAFSTAEKSASEMIKGLLDEVNASELLNIIMGESSVKYSPEAFSTAEKSASEMIKGLLDGVNASDLLNIIMGESSVKSAQEAFSMVDNSPSEMIKDLLDEVNASDLLDIIMGSIEVAKNTDVTAFSIETVGQIEPCLNTMLFEAEAEAESVFSIASGEFCTSFCEN